jgi:ferredoxin
VKNGACVEVCPVDCIHTTPEDRQHYIDPDVCIECEQCVLVCPVEAVFLDRELPPQWEQYSEINAAFFQRRKQAVTAVSTERAHSIIHAVHAKATELGAAVSVAVVDRDGHVIAEDSMPYADAASVDEARRRASATASAFAVPAEDRSSVLIASGPKGSYVQTLGKLQTQSGALPIVDGVNLIGALGVAGGSDQQNHEACRVGLTGH